jgi:hypothetical protein
MNKAQKVIDSCQTALQARVALRYLHLLQRSGADVRQLRRQLVARWGVELCRG